MNLTIWFYALSEEFLGFLGSIIRMVSRQFINYLSA